MRQRLYPVTTPVLASYWLRTVYAGGHKRAWWRELEGLLGQALDDRMLNAPSRQALGDLQSWIRQSILVNGKTPDTPETRVEPFRANLRRERLGPYIGRLLNEWLPAEVANLLVNGNEMADPQDGMPVLAVGRALERLLVRERLSPATLEMLLDPELLSPQYAYPADVEMLQDVVLALLGRTSAPAPSVMPATLLAVATGSPFPGNYREDVRRAFLVQGREGQEVHVPIAAAEGLEILKGDLVRIASIIVTMDGRWWESGNLQSGDPYSVVYKPGGRLRIDYSSDHARLDVPWPQTELRWRGEVHLPGPFEIFGREWHASSWESDGERTWMHLAFSHAVTMAEIPQPAVAAFRRSHPAFIDMAWAAMADALAAASSQKSLEPIEQLHRSDFIPLGRALFGLAESTKNRRMPSREAMETQLKAIRYLEAEICQAYGRVPWRILPLSVQTAVLKRRPDAALADLLHQAFDGLPEGLDPSIRRRASSGQAAPPQAA